MKTEAILEILNAWNFWHRDISPFVGHVRSLREDLVKSLHLPEVKVLTGVRRGGKTTLLYQVMDFLMKREQSTACCLYVNFEDPALAPSLTVELIAQMYRAYREHIYPRGQAFVFLDEVQNVPDWERWVRSTYDQRAPAQVFVTGSSSSLLQSEYSSLITGRNLSFVVSPFNFREYLAFQGIEAPDEPDYLALLEQKAQIKFHLANYLKWGGFPEVVKRGEDERAQLLKQYFEDIINKDIIARHSVRDSFGLRKLAAYLLQNTGNLLSFTSLQKSLGLHKDTAQEYLSYFTDAYLMQQTLFFAFSLRKSLANNRKVYAGDTGLRNAASLQFTPDLGRLAENVVYLHLRQSFNEIYYWKNRQEVDFVAVEGDKLLPVNVCYAETVPPREEKGLREFMKIHKSPRALLISEERYGREAGEHGEILYIPLWYFLLQSPSVSHKQALAPI